MLPTTALAVADLKNEPCPQSWKIMKILTRKPAARIASGNLPAEFAGWPLAWDDTGVLKVTIIMSDGVNTRLNEIDRYGRKYAVIDNEGDVNNATLGLGDVRLAEICAAAKTGASSVVYTIGFELTSSVAIAALNSCRTNPSTSYLVDGLDLTVAFRDIADDIVNLKLTN